MADSITVAILIMVIFILIFIVAGTIAVIVAINKLNVVLVRLDRLITNTELILVRLGQIIAGR